MNFFNKENMTNEERRNRAAIILLAYFIFFIFLFAMIANSKNEKKEVKEDTKKIHINKRIDNIIDSKKYDYELTINNNYYLYYTVGGNKITGKKTLNNKSYEFSILDNKYYYLIEKDNLKKVKYFDIYEGYDNVFSDINNIKELFKGLNKTTIKSNKNITTESFYIYLNDYLDIYNKIYLTNFKDDENTKIENSVEYTNDYVNINLDVTEVYKITNKLNNELIYNIKLSKIEK